MSDDSTGDDDHYTESDRCPVCGTPVLSIVIRGPSPAERYAQPCGHRLPADWNGDGQTSNDADDEDDEDASASPSTTSDSDSNSNAEPLGGSASTGAIETFACSLCDRRFITEQARDGHEAMCPANPDRREPTEWHPDTHGRWNSTPSGSTRDECNGDSS